MYSFHSSAEEKNRLLLTLTQYGIETTVDRSAKKDRIRDWIQASVITEGPEEEDNEEDDKEEEGEERQKERKAMEGKRENRHKTDNETPTSTNRSASHWTLQTMEDVCIWAYFFPSDGDIDDPSIWQQQQAVIIFIWESGRVLVRSVALSYIADSVHQAISLKKRLEFLKIIIHGRYWTLLSFTVFRIYISRNNFVRSFGTTETTCNVIAYFLFHVMYKCIFSFLMTSSLVLFQASNKSVFFLLPRYMKNCMSSLVSCNEFSGTRMDAPLDGLLSAGLLRGIGQVATRRLQRQAHLRTRT